MTFLERYKRGETKIVYEEIAALGGAAFSSQYSHDVQNVLKETFERTNHNLQIIYEELKKTGYCLKTYFEYDDDHPVLPPPAQTEHCLKYLDSVLAPYGYIPEALRALYKYTGACNFVWDYDENPDNFWQGADPLQIISIGSVMEEVQNTIEEDEHPVTGLVLSADYLHKDEFSGGSPYMVKIMDRQTVDAPVIADEWESSILEYLRLAFRYGGFLRGREMQQADFKAYVDRVYPQLLPI